MKLDDDKTRSVAGAVGDVLEGKHKMKKEEVKYPHKMYSKDGKDEVEVKDKAEHDKYAAKGYVHDKPKMESPEEPRAKGEKEFKAKHTVKKSGENNDGSVTKEGKLPPALQKAIDAKKKKDGKDDVEEVLGFDKDNPKNVSDDDEDEKKKDVKEKKFNPRLIKKAIAMAKKSSGRMTPVAKEVEKLAKGLSDHPDVRDAFRVANESTQAEESDKQKKYKAFFDKALKKFGVNSPAELKGDKKKEFFDYVDKNYEADNEAD